MMARRTGRVRDYQLGTGSAGNAPESRFLAPTATKSPNAASDIPPAFLALSERQFQAILVAALRRRGFTVWTVPNMKLTTAGLPDVLAWHERLPGLLLALELKRERDYRVTPAQRAALAHLETVPGIESRVLRPSEWEWLRDTLDLMLKHAPAAPPADGSTEEVR